MCKSFKITTIPLASPYFTDTITLSHIYPLLPLFTPSLIHSLTLRPVVGHHACMCPRRQTQLDHQVVLSLRVRGKPVTTHHPSALKQIVTDHYWYCCCYTLWQLLQLLLLLLLLLLLSPVDGDDCTHPELGDVAYVVDQVGSTGLHISKSITITISISGAAHTDTHTTSTSVTYN